jgi:hypothetical protein
VSMRGGLVSHSDDCNSSCLLLWFAMRRPLVEFRFPYPSIRSLTWVSHSLSADYCCVHERTLSVALSPPANTTPHGDGCATLMFNSFGSGQSKWDASARENSLYWYE